MQLSLLHPRSLLLDLIRDIDQRLVRQTVEGDHKLPHHERVRQDLHLEITRTRLHRELNDLVPFRVNEVGSLTCLLALIVEREPNTRF
jgi:hypothetical protein